MAELKNTDASSAGMHAEQLSGRTQQVFFDVESRENEDRFLYPGAFEVDFDKHGEIDAADLTARDINTQIRDLMNEGVGSITIKNPGAKHSLGVGLLNRLNLSLIHI